jgi:hypothetical protein
MKISGMIVGMILGVALGIVGTAFCVGPPSVKQAAERRLHHPTLLHAGGNDRFEDYVMCTGAVTVNQRSQLDGVWLLDYRAGKLLSTVIDRGSGKIGGWAELDLTKEFGIPPKQNVHFMMTTGTISQGQAALYVAETTSGKFSVYTLGTDATGSGLSIRRHDMVSFRPKGN